MFTTTKGSTMKKSDVQLGYHNDSYGKPMLNIKVHGPYPYPTLELAQFAELETGETGFAEWLMSMSDDERHNIMQTWWDVACESNFEQATEEAGEVFGERYGRYAHRERKVWQAGRSGGWLYVDDLPDVETWDAIMLGKWARYARIVQSLVDDVPRLALELCAINTYAVMVANRDARDRLAENIAADAMLELVASHR